MYVSNAGAVEVIGRFLVENLIRIPLTLLTLPVWAVNEGVRKIQKSRGKTQNRSIRLPWIHSLSYYTNQQLFKKKTIGFSTYRSFKERFIKHNTDFEAMDRADQDYYNATEGSDYSDDDEDDEGSEN